MSTHGSITGRRSLWCVKLKVRQVVLHELDRTDVRGRHHSDWVATLDRLRTRGLDAPGLELLLECMAAAEQEAWSLGAPPTPVYAHRAAVIHRRQRDYAAEVEVLERWIDACPEPRDPFSRLAVRLVKARRLRDGVGQARRRA